MSDSDDDDDDDDHDDDGHVSKPLFDGSAFDRKPFKADLTQDIAVRSSISAPVLIDDDEPEEDLGPEHAALQARIRARLADRKSGKPSTAPITELLITSDIPDTIPLRVKVRIDTLIEKPRKAWCGKQNFPPKFADEVFFTWNLTRIYDSTSVARLGIKVDDNGNITMEGDSSIYDDVNLPKVHVEAWTDELFRERKKEDAAAAAAKKLASEPPVEVEQRTPTPEPVPEPTKLRLVLKAKGMPECKLTVNLVCASSGYRKLEALSTIHSNRTHRLPPSLILPVLSSRGSRLIRASQSLSYPKVNDCRPWIRWKTASLWIRNSLTST